MDVSMVKHTTLLPCIGLSESSSKLYINFEFFEGKIINIWKHIDLQSQTFYVDRRNFKKSLHILKDGTSNVEVGILNM